MPLLQSSGVLEAHYTHDTDLVNLYGHEMSSYSVWQNAGANHGWINLAARATVAWIQQQHELIRHPTIQNVAADCPRRCYDIEFLELRSDTNMARAHLSADSLLLSDGWHLYKQRVTLIRNASRVRMYGELTQRYDTLRLFNLDTARVEFQLKYPIPVEGDEWMFVANPPLPGYFSNTDLCYVFSSVPVHYSGAIYVEFHSSVEENPTRLPEGFKMSVFPNPFNAQSTVRLSAPRPGTYDVGLYNIEGREIRKLSRRFMHSSGSITFSLPTNGVASGTYFLRATDGKNATTQRVTILK